MNNSELLIARMRAKATNCFYCGIDFTPKINARVNFIWPEEKGGTTHWFNIAICCSECESKKKSENNNMPHPRLAKRVRDKATEYINSKDNIPQDELESLWKMNAAINEYLKPFLNQLKAEEERRKNRDRQLSKQSRHKGNRSHQGARNERN